MSDNVLTFICELCYHTTQEVLKMNKVTRLKYYIESLCIYDFEDDDVFSALYDLLCDDEEDTVALQNRKCKAIQYNI